VEAFHLLGRNVDRKFGKLEGNKVSVDARSGEELPAAVFGDG
jgi:hypothetical protein